MWNDGDVEQFVCVASGFDTVVAGAREFAETTGEQVGDGGADRASAAVVMAMSYVVVVVPSPGFASSVSRTDE